MRILKFGGKSLSSKEKVQNICKYIKNIYKNDKNLIIVVSAMGKTTDELFELANNYTKIEPEKFELAKLLSTGELVSSALFSIMLNSMNIPAKSLSAYELQITTYGDALNSRIAYINKKPIVECFENNKVAIVAGFQGINNQNQITTLGRGGSDTTASALGALFDCNVEIYSDFNGVFSGDPRLLNYKKLKSASYDQIIKLAEGGAKVLDSRALIIAKSHHIKIFSKSSSEPLKKGTVISDLESDIICISSIDHLTKITITFSNDKNLKFIVKNVINCIEQIKFYNFEIQNSKISFFIDTQNKLKILSQISKKLKLISNK